jgi:hypothetical protein
VFDITASARCALAQGIRIERPPPGTLRRGVLALDSPKAPTLLLVSAITVVALLLVAAAVRRLRAR